MRSLTVRALLAALLCAALATTVAAQAPSAADKIRKLREGLNQKITLDFNGQSFEEGLDHLRQKTKLTITTDQMSMQMLGIGIGIANPNFPGGGGVQTPVRLKVDNGPVRVALQKMLSPYGLTYILLNDSVHIISEQSAYQRQLRQRVSVDVDAKPLAAALKSLADDTGITLLIEPRLAKDAESKVTLNLEDATLETALRLLTELGGLKAVQVGNVVFVTDAKKAAQIRQENNENQRNSNSFPPFIGFGQAFPGGGIIGGGGFPQAIPPVPAKQAPPVPPPPGQ